MNINRVLKVLKSMKLDAWSVLFQEQQRSTLHLTTKGEIETNIDSVRKQAEVVIYRNFKKQMGDAKFTLFTDDEKEIKRKVKDALVICSTAKKEAWPLPGKQRYGTVDTADPAIVKAFKNGSAEKLNLSLWNRMKNAVKKERGVRMNHAELHLTHTKNRIANSKGLNGRSEATELFVEAIVTALGKEENEFHNVALVGRARDFKPDAFVKETAVQARDVVRAAKMTTIQDEGILLSGTALRDFWAPDLTHNAVVYHANAQAKHRNLSYQEPGKRLTWNEGFSLKSNPFLAFNPASGRFDNEGNASKEVSIIEQGVCQDFFASQRYAHYLKISPTGALGAIQIDPGTERAASLRTKGAIEIVSFSSFVPNSLSGDFSAEIRLGYRYEKGKRIPVKGAMFTGNIFKMLDHMRLSKEEMELARYKGPSLIRFDAGAHLAGFTS